MKELLCLLMCGLHLQSFSQQVYWQQQVNHIIDVELNDTEHTLDGFEKIEYYNNSPDTLLYIWFHLWPNAYRNDKTALSEQLLADDRTDFYFSHREQRGYINRLHFQVNGITARLEDHREHIDIIKLILPTPLPPGQNITITTPFHIKLPHNFSGAGHIKQSYQVTQWYPRPAVYDKKGWHPMPLLQRGDEYTELGSYDVRITVPENYVVAATGELQNENEINWMLRKALPVQINSTKKQGTKSNRSIPGKPDTASIVSSSRTKSLRYMQSNVAYFVWFADKRFLVKHDTIMTSPGKPIHLFTYFLQQDAEAWSNGLSVLKSALRKRSVLHGPYPYDVLSAVDIETGNGYSNAYPTIFAVPTIPGKTFEQSVKSNADHNWMPVAIASNKRDHPWMHVGLNGYYDEELTYIESKGLSLKNPSPAKRFFADRLPGNSKELHFETSAALKKDQPVNTFSEIFSRENYHLNAGYKAVEWMKELKTILGRDVFDSCMQSYYRLWKFKHPYPEDFKRVVDSISGINTDAHFDKLNKTGSLRHPVNRSLALTTFFNLKDTDKKSYVSIAPSLGANAYDGLMIGGLIHNYQLPLNRLSFIIIPMYAFSSKKVTGILRTSYTWYPGKFVHSVDFGAAASTFTMNRFQQEGHKTLYPSFRKMAPFIKITFDNRDPLSKVERHVQFKSFFIKEDELVFNQVITPTDTIDQVTTNMQSRNINQLRFVVRNDRVLYPYKAEVQLEQHKDFLRAAFTGHYHFNYANQQGGMDVRLFAGKFLHTGSRTASGQFATARYHLNLTGPNGYEDYTYSSYFAGRNYFQQWPSQQIMIRDGAFKVRSDQLSSKIGKTDNWLIAANLSTPVPAKVNPFRVLPFRVPLKIFADIGTYAEAWQKNAATTRFLFDAGFQLSLLNETINIYFPIIYSAAFKDYFRSTLGQNRFFKTVSFSIDIQNFNEKKTNGLLNGGKYF